MSPAPLSYRRVQLVSVSQEPLPLSTAERLWTELRHAKEAASPSDIARHEDALFAFYLPWAVAAASDICPAEDGDAVGYRQAAENALAHAVLSWRSGPVADFEAFARQSIGAQLRRHDALQAHQRRRQHLRALRRRVWQRST